ncbi:Ca2+-binding EF-hand superfamily protein [Labrenzia sp. MBR-25]|jgi:Ca2+-binding EF-hand superfamily protein|uniref:EF-hand domain-containing protein n=2 Tax=Stappiaceae TaxID=2821832 RepID=UPI000A999F83|nr:EF-hand domain-containing protein [Roseibium aggregatum]UFI06792.1 EF-hand domain-containing protein [Roseibium aggregatum]
MKIFPMIAAAMILSVATPGLALADSEHGHGASEQSAEETGPMGGQAGMMQNMMRMMMQMHGQMMENNMQGQGGGNPMAMMDGKMMRMMMGGDMMGAPGAGEGRTNMLSRLKEFDADGDGTLSLSEFETLHAAMIRDTTVDRFQHLDADGDGKITEAEMAAPARRMKMRGMTPGSQGMMNRQAPSED